MKGRPGIRGAARLRLRDLAQKKTPATSAKRSGAKMEAHCTMTNRTIDPPAQAGVDACNPYLRILLRMKLGDEGWSFQRLAVMMGWKRHPEFLADVTELAYEMGLIERPPSARILILPVPLRPRPEPPPPAPPPDRHDPAPWAMEVLSQKEQPEARPERQPASWSVDRENDDG